MTYTRDNEPGAANSTDPEAVIRQGGATVISIGRNNFSPRYTNARTIQWADSLSYVHGRHTFKAGLDMNFQHIDNFFPGNFSGSYTFNSYADFASNQPVQLHPGIRRRAAPTGRSPRRTSMSTPSTRRIPGASPSSSR